MGPAPPKLRSEILQSTTEGFPPGYENLLQSYYQQLSEEKSLDDKPIASATAPDSTASASKSAASKSPASNSADSKPPAP